MSQPASFQPPAQRLRLRKPYLFGLLCLMLLLCASGSYSEEDSYSSALASGFDALAGQLATSSFAVRDLAALDARVKAAISADKRETAILLLTVNQAVVLNEINAPEVVFFFELLLDGEALPLAQRWMKQAQKIGDGYTLARLHYQLAKHYYRHGDHDKTLEHLTAIEDRNALTANESDYATLIFGITLQHRKEHRTALKYYGTLDEKSRYFGYAQLNKAVAFIRQGWWTDARIAIDAALAHELKLTETLSNENDLPEEELEDIEEFTNRLYLVLGYNQIQHEFYRNARDNFRHITLESRYADRALLGIGLCALNQGDYVGAINAFGILKGKDKLNISITEAYLLYAFTHEQMGQSALASAQYEEAIAYYNNRLRTLEKLLTSNTSDHFSEQEQHLTSTRLASPPTHLLKRQSNLRFIQASLQKSPLAALLDKASLEVNSRIASYYRDQLNEEKKLLVSYLSQAQFGQAKLFDNVQ